MKVQSLEYEKMRLHVSTNSTFMFMENLGVTLMSFFSSRGTPARGHSSVFRTGKRSDVYRCLVVMAISCSMMSPKLRHSYVMMDARQVVLGGGGWDHFVRA